MAESAERRRARYERKKAMLAANPEARAEFAARGKAATQRYLAKKRQEADPETVVVRRKPGRIVALCGWRGW